MRDIKFRGKRLDDGEWFIGGVVFDNPQKIYGSKLTNTWISSRDMCFSIKEV